MCGGNPVVKALHDRARAAGLYFAYTMPGNGKIIDEGIAPRDGEVVEQKQADPTNFWATISMSG